MSFEDYLDDLCDIYHLQTNENSPGYNLPSSPSHSYPPEAHHKAVPCHFNVKAGSSSSLVQNEPQNEFTARTKLNLRTGTDIRLHDKVVNCGTGFEYTVVTPPRTIRGHHVYVQVERVREQRPL